MNGNGRRYCYFIKPVGMAGPVKIGCSNKPARRLIALSVWSPFELEVIAVTPGGLDLEKRLHAHFADERLRSEWFAPSDRLIKCCNMLKRGFDLATALAATPLELAAAA